MLINSDFEITVLKVVAANRLSGDRTEGAPIRRFRKRWALVLKSSGVTYYTINGRDVLSDREHIVLLPRSCAYSWHCTEPGEYLMLEFEAPQIGDDILSFFVADNSFFVRDFEHIQKCLHTPTPEARLETVYRLYSILLQLFKTTAKEYLPKGKKQLLQPAVDHITKMYYDPQISNDRLAKLCGISTVYFRKCFEAAYGEPPIRYLHKLRTQRAKDILSGDFVSINQVAESVGYSTIYHFSKMFKAYTGVSPTAYAKAARK